MLYPLNALYHVQQQFSVHLREKVYIVWSNGGMYPNSKVHGANMGPSGADRIQVGPMLAPWTSLSGYVTGQVEWKYGAFA